MPITSKGYLDLLSNEDLIHHFHRLFDLNGASLTIDRTAPDIIRATGKQPPGIRIYNNDVGIHDEESWICTEVISLNKAYITGLKREIASLEANAYKDSFPAAEGERLKQLQSLLKACKQPVTFIYRMDYDIH